LGGVLGGAKNVEIPTGTALMPPNATQNIQEFLFLYKVCKNKKYKSWESLGGVGGAWVAS